MFENKIPRFCDHEITDVIHGANGKLLLKNDGTPAMRTRPCSAPLFEMSRWRLVSHSPLGSLVASSPALIVTDFKSGETYQLSLFGEAVSLPPRKGRRR